MNIPDIPAVPAQNQKYVDRLRRFIGDTPELNSFLEDFECDDLYLWEALEDSLDAINYEYEPVSVNFTLDTFPSWNLLKNEAVLQILTGKGILSARNTVSYNDSGNLGIKEQDVFGRYINYYNILVSKQTRAIMTMKRSANAERAYGGVHSEYLDESSFN